MRPEESAVTKAQATDFDEQKSAPLVSVVVPCYNQARFLKDSVGSILFQNYANFEVVVVNDGSSDDTSSVVKAFQDERVRLVEQENSGLSAARNAGIRASKGDFICILDADDFMTENCLKLRAEILIAEPEVGLVAGHYRETDLCGNLLPRIPEVRRFPLKDHFHYIVGQSVPNCGWMFRRRAVELCGGFDPLLKAVEDWDFIIRVASRYRLAYVSETTVHVRQVPGSMSRGIVRMFDMAKNVFRKNRMLSTAPLTYFWRSQVGMFNQTRHLVRKGIYDAPPGMRFKVLLFVSLRRPSFFARFCLIVATYPLWRKKVGL